MNATILSDVDIASLRMYGPREVVCLAFKEGYEFPTIDSGGARTQFWRDKAAARGALYAVRVRMKPVRMKHRVALS